MSNQNLNPFSQSLEDVNLLMASLVSASQGQKTLDNASKSLNNNSMASQKLSAKSQPATKTLNRARSFQADELAPALTVQY